VQSVSPGGPAEQAGIAPGDIVTEIDGDPARNVDALLRASLTREAGDEVSVTYLRGGEPTTTTAGREAADRRVTHRSPGIALDGTSF
jgi:putative serine protease PepD